MNDVIAGQEPAEMLHDLHVQYSDLVLRMVSRQVRWEHRDQVEDHAQEVWLRTWQYLAAGSQILRPAGFLGMKARQVVAEHYRLARATREVPADFTGELGGRRLPSEPSAEDLTVARIAAILDWQRPVLAVAA